VLQIRRWLPLSILRFDWVIAEFPSFSDINDTNLTEILLFQVFVIVQWPRSVAKLHRQPDACARHGQSFQCKKMFLQFECQWRLQGSRRIRRFPCVAVLSKCSSRHSHRLTEPMIASSARVGRGSGFAQRFPSTTVPIGPRRGRSRSAIVSELWDGGSAFHDIVQPGPQLGRCERNGDQPASCD
jgi:hypothetical protein